MYGWLVALSQPEYERVSLGMRGGRDDGGEVAGNRSNAPR